MDYTSFSPLDVVGSPVFNIAKTFSQFPGINSTGLESWLDTNPTFQGIRNFQGQHPGWAGAVDLAGYAVPFAGWDAALGRAGLEGAGLLGGVNRTAKAAAGLFPTSRALGYGAATAVHYAPLAAGMTAFDTLGGRLTNPFDVAGSFLGNTVGFGLGNALGHAASPLIGKIPLIGPTWKAVFDPSPELQALYGFTTGAQEAARRAAAVPDVQQALNPALEPQQRAAMIWDLQGKVREAQASAASGTPPSDLRLLEIDPNLLDSQYDEARRQIFTNQLDSTQTGIQGTNINARNRRVYDFVFRDTAMKDGSIVTIPLTGKPTQVNNPDNLASTLGLPEGWVHRTILPRIQQTTLEAAGEFAKNLGLGTEAQRGIQQLERTGPGGARQLWAMSYEPESNSYIMATRIPGEQRMTGRANFPETMDMDKAEPGRAFFTFKTNDPGHFLPDLKINIDEANPMPDSAYQFADRVPKGQSPILDRMMDFKRLYLASPTLKAIHNALLDTKGAAEEFTKEVLGGPVMGKEIWQTIEKYAAPTQQQGMKSPEARGILGMYQAAFDNMEESKNALLYGTANLKEGKAPIASLFGQPSVDDSEALITQLRKLDQEDKNTVELIRRVVKQRDIDPESLAGVPQGALLDLMDKVSEKFVTDRNHPLEILGRLDATNSKPIVVRQKHYGLSNSWEGDYRIPVYKAGAVEPDTVIAGNTLEQVQTKANQWLADRARALREAGKAPEERRLGRHYVVGQDEEIPGFIRLSPSNPGLLEPRIGLMGYEHQYTPYKHLDDLIKELEDNYAARSRYYAGAYADSLTTSQLNKLRTFDPHNYGIVVSRIAQMKGQPGPWERFQNRIVDTALKRYIGTDGASKAAEVANEFNFHMINGAGNIATPALNMFNYLQTSVPAAVEFLTEHPDRLKLSWYHFPVLDPNGNPKSGFHTIPDMLGLMWGGIKQVTNPSETNREVLERLTNMKIMGASLANEYSGQDRTIALRASEGIKGPEDFAYWAKRVSSLLMTKTEQISRFLSAGIGLHAMDQWEKIYGVPFTMEQRVNNAARMVLRSNYGFYKWDRPQMYTTPLGSIYGNQKTWITNFWFMMAHYFGLGTERGNWAPFLTMMGTATALGGVFAVPVLAQGIDTVSNMFAKKSGQEAIYDQLGEGGNAVSFGLPGLLGLSFQGNLSVPGSNLAHDTNFFFSIMALERAKSMGQAVGRAWDDQVILGLNPMRDSLFQRQAASAFAPRSLYRAWEAATSDEIVSKASGLPLVRNLSPADRAMRAMGFSTADIDLQYSAYERLLANKQQMGHVVGVLADAYARASIEHKPDIMAQVLRQVAVTGVDLNAVMRSARGKMHDLGYDMFGRNFRPEVLNRERAVLDAADRRSS